jgi:hypothetical protein
VDGLVEGEEAVDLSVKGQEYAMKTIGGRLRNIETYA